MYFDVLTNNESYALCLPNTFVVWTAITPLHVHALVVNSLYRSSWRCVKGGDQLAKLLAKSIREKAGGDVLRKKTRHTSNWQNDKAVYAENLCRLTSSRCAVYFKYVPAQH